MDFFFFFGQVTFICKMENEKVFCTQQETVKKQKNIKTGKVLGSERSRVSKGSMCIHKINN